MSRTIEITPLERVLTTLGHKEPDRVPFFLLMTTHGAKALGLSIKDYFSKARHVFEGQVALQEKYGHDCYYNLFYAAMEVQAWGGEVVFHDDGPPDSAAPFIREPLQINTLEPPDVSRSPLLLHVLDATRMLAEKSAGRIPIIGVAMSPFSLPVMQMGFEAYIELIYRQPKLFDTLMAVNEIFCANWANAQLAAGATAICYFDPVSSPTIIPRDLYLKTGFQVAKRALARIKGPTATHLASGMSLPIVHDIAETGTAGIGVSAREDLKQVKAACRNKLSVIGNLNALEMVRWNREDAHNAVKQAISEAAPGGGFILSDNHGEIPWHVPDEVLLAISEAVHEYGRYPINLLETHHE